MQNNDHTTEYLMGEYDIIVIGAGHAGCEAGLAAARMGKKTLMLSINLEAVAMMPCNPSIGGTGKGHLVREIDALGGEMGINTDKTFIQSRMLNTAKGPAVHSLRAQADKNRYHLEMKKTIEREPLLDMKQGEVVDLVIEDGAARGVVFAPKTASAQTESGIQMWHPRSHRRKTPPSADQARLKRSGPKRSQFK